MSSFSQNLPVYSFTSIQLHGKKFFHIVRTSGIQPFLHNRPFLKRVGPKCPHKALMSKNKKVYTSAQIYYSFAENR